MRIRFCYFLLGLFSLLALPMGNSLADEGEGKGVIRVGWIGQMTGPMTKYGTYQAAILAAEDINSRGGIRGKKLELVFENGAGQGKNAAVAAHKLIHIDKVKYIVGGHCSPESLAMAPIAEKNKVVMLAAVTSSPKLSTAGEYIFRVTASNIRGEIIAPYLANTLKLKTIAIVFAETEYAAPFAEHLRKVFEELGVKVVEFQGFHAEDTDFRAVITRIRGKKPEAVFIGVQSPDSVALFLRQLRELGVNARLFGNEVSGNSVTSNLQSAELFEGMVFAEPSFDMFAPRTLDFTKRFLKRFNVDAVPAGLFTAEAYDAVGVLANVIERCGEEVEKVKACLSEVQNYSGVSGLISIDKNGDGVRTYVVKQVVKGRPTLVQ